MVSRSKKIRLDKALVELGWTDSLEYARRLIMTGTVLVDDEPMDKPGTLIKADSPIRIKTKKNAGPYAGRGGLKLEAAIQAFGIDVEDSIALDLGASTGGFTDCLLRFGARKVYAVDVGTNQMIYRLRTDPRVVCLERTHANKLTKALVPETISFWTADVSFTSLTRVLPFVFPLLAPGAEGMCLFKPQFEADRGKVGPGGVIGEREAGEAASAMETWFADQGCTELGKMKSPLKGRGGNQEYFYWIRRG